MKKVFMLGALLVAFHTVAQVPKKVIVEHFTNSWCGICANRNPGFYENLANHPDVLHFAIHPSSPYAGCLRNQNNTAENDARTNYYGVYGGTPRLVINGDVIPASADYDEAMLFDPYENQTSPVSIIIRQTKFGMDSMRVKFVIVTEAANALQNLSMFLALAEDTVFYTSPNGETMHHDVYRKALDGGASISVTPAALGDSLSFTTYFDTDPDWNYDRLFAVAILQDGVTKEVVQTEASSPEDNFMEPVTTGIAAVEANVSVFPNPATRTVHVSTNSYSDATAWWLTSTLGQTVLYQPITKPTTQVSLRDVPAGIYLYRLQTAYGLVGTGKIVVE